MNRHRPRTLTHVDPTLADASFPASPFAAFLLHRHAGAERSTPSVEHAQRSGDDETARAASAERPRLGR